MADIKKFTGYIAPDGSTHDTVKKATDYTKDLKVKAALTEKFAELTTASNGVSEDDAGNPCVYPEGMPQFLFDNRAAILAAFAQDVTLRAPRKAKPKTVVNASA